VSVSRLSLVCSNAGRTQLGRASVYDLHLPPPTDWRTK
jgi:hypothetical protein